MVTSARLFAGEMMVHLGVENSFRQGLLQIVEQPVRVENRLRVGTSQQLVEDSVGDARVFASRHRWAPFLRSCPNLCTKFLTVLPDPDFGGLDRRACQGTGLHGWG